jgi:hypothetical protein
MESQSEQLERAAEETRWQLSGTLEELRGRLTPGRIVDQLIDNTRDGPAGEFVRNLGREVRKNPMPLLLIGIGIAWLMVGSSRSSRALIASAADSVAETAEDIAAATADASSKTVGRGQHPAARLSERASHVARTAGNNTAELASRAGDVIDGLADKARTASAAEAPSEKAKWPSAVLAVSDEEDVGKETGAEEARACELR